MIPTRCLTLRYPCCILCTMGSNVPLEWEYGSVPAETADRQKKNEHGKSNLHAEEDFL